MATFYVVEAEIVRDRERKLIFHVIEAPTAEDAKRAQRRVIRDADVPRHSRAKIAEQSARRITGSTFITSKHIGTEDR
jgi:hypothetical protein